MPRKRKGVPQKVDEEKRQCLSWNMFDDFDSQENMHSDHDATSQQSTSQEGTNPVTPVVADTSLVETIENANHPAVSSQSKCSFLNLENSISQSEYNKIWEAAEYSITVHDALKVKQGEWTGKLGEFRVKLGPFIYEEPERKWTAPKVLPDYEKFSLFINNDSNLHYLIYDCYGNNNENINNARPDNIYSCFKIQIEIPKSRYLDDLEYLHRYASGRLLRVVKSHYDQVEAEVVFDVYLLKSFLSKLKYQCQPGNSGKLQYPHLQGLMEWFYEVPVYNVEETRKGPLQDINVLFDNVRDYHANEKRISDVDPQHPSLLPMLRPYQSHGVLWMLEREHYGKDSRAGNQGEEIHPLWREIKIKDDKILFYNIYNGEIVLDKPSRVPQHPGGILADEMGLGKTVEVLACMLLHPRTDLSTQNLLRDMATNEQKEDNKKLGDDCQGATDKTMMSISDSKEVSSNETETTGQKQSTCQNGHGCVGVTPAIKDMNTATETNQVIEMPVSSGKAEMTCGNACEDRISVDKNDNGKGSEEVVTVEQGCVAGNAIGGPSSANQDQGMDVDNHNSDSMGVDDQKGGNNGKAVSRTTGEQLVVKPTKKTASYWSRLGARSQVQFQCICGVKETEKEKDEKLRVKCGKCDLWQHAECVNYDWEHDVKYYCPHCLVAMPPLPSCATLIISPTSICHQWVDEINRHIKTATLKVLVYQGVKKHSFIQPHVLGGYDIVITTYETLRNEINYVDLPHSNSDEGRRFRHAKRYMAVPSPITAVQWWRVCLDEAQMVECATTKAAEMALRLSAVNRWCVTGTPIQKGMEDLYGLFLFLGVDPYWVKYWWNKLLYQPYLNGNPRPVNEAVAKVLWRTAKKDVLDQINIPSQAEKIHWLRFSPVEEHFYRRKHEDCAQDVIRVLNKYPQKPETKLSRLDRQVVHAMMWPLLRLRQACCHPQAVRGEFIPLNKSTMTMEELLKSLTQKTKLECEEAHRQLICALNGLAALHLIKEEHEEAADKYREVFRSVEEHKGQLKTDSLQRLHALHNLHELLSQNHPGIAPTLRDSELKKEADDIKSTYMAKANALVSQTEKNLRVIQEKITELKSKFQKGSDWWLDCIARSIYTYEDEDLVQRIKEELESKASTDRMSIVNKFRDVRGLQYVLTSHLEKLQESHAKLLQTLHDLSVDATPEMLNSVIECHLRPFKGIVKKDCVFCAADDVFSEYETKLFSMQTRNLQELVIEEGDGDTLVMGQGSRTTGTWAVGEIERTLKQILGFMKLRYYGDEQIQYGNIHMEMFENLRKEFKCLRSVWMALRDRVAAMDEIEMTTMRLRLLLPDEPHDPDSQPYIVEPSKFDLTRLKHLSDKVVATSELRKKLGQLLYLTNLAKAQDGSQDGCNPEPCPICDRQLGTQWSVLHCGHCFCNDCMDILIRQYSMGGRRGAIKCAICRQRTPVREVSYVSTDPSSHLDEDDRHINVKGSHSTKVEAVVRTLRKIQHKEPGAKSLVFSTWQDVLDVVAQALKENNSEFRYVTNAGHRHFQAHLHDFKYDNRVTTLLLPVHCGSHGLNIVEATHVLLVEPIINPASELQAVGRVHRIGQTRATVVHRFLVRNTVEDRIHAMLKPLHSRATLDTTQSDAAILTVRDLRLLFSQHQQHDEDAETSQLPTSQND